MKKNYVSNSEESVRMFKSNFMEFFSKVHFSVPLFLYVPVVLFFAIEAFVSQHVTVVGFIGFYLIGIATWSAVEYFLHRFVFHFVPKSKWGLRMHFVFHGVHHDYPNDTKRLVMPPAVSIPLAFIFYFLFSTFLSKALLWSFFPGFVSGYLFYDISHYALHHFNFKSEFWKKLKKHHMLHHYSDSSKGYGVSSKVWDLIMQSDFEKK
ncbi:MAG: sterol desaturase family protein [Bacteroidetes bacterium]|nr:sterol desaturase family protein [Bacteroidota bacterium]